MIRSSIIRAISRQSVASCLSLRATVPVATLNQVARLHQSYPLLAKGGKKNKKAPKEVVEEVSDGAPKAEIDFDDATKKFEGILDKFVKSANEIKLGKSSPNIFDKLMIETEDGEQIFTNVAQTTLKGRNFVITVFDPANTQHIVNAVLSSDLNMNPQVDPSSKLTLKVPSPPVTTETKKENAKHLKQVFEKFKSSTTKSNASLHAIRTDVRNKFQKKMSSKRGTDEEQKLLNEFELLHKKYNDKLQDAFKNAETAILK